MSMPTRCAVVIVGGGIAGCASALSLLQQGIEDVVVVDAQSTTDAFRIGETLPPTCGAVLRRLGLWEAFVAQAHLPSDGSASSWGSDALGYNDAFFDPHGCGWHLDRSRFDHLLAEQVAQRGGRVLTACRLRTVSSTDQGWALTLEHSGEVHSLESAFLVDATGVAAAAVRRLGVARNQVDCLTFHHALYELDAPDAVPARTLLEAVEHGWWYTARLPGNRLVVALAADPTYQRYRGTDGVAAWQEGLRQTRYIHAFVQAGSPRAQPDALGIAPAPTAILSRVVGERWLAVGDAASCYDPITSHGMLKALQDGEAAGIAIAGALNGSDEALLAYQAGVFARFRGYLAQRQHLYGLERRWPEASFWQRAC